MVKFIVTPRLYIKVRESTGYTKKYIIEIKPKKQTAPPKKPKRQTSGYLRGGYEYAKNQAKWEAASEWCKDRITFSKYSLRKNSASNEQSQASRRQLKCR